MLLHLTGEKYRLLLKSVLIVLTLLVPNSPRLVRLIKIDAFSSHDGYPGAYTIHTKKQLIESSLKKANNDCCPINRPSDYEVAALFGVVKKLVPDVVKVLNTIVTKRLEFDNLALATALLKKDIKQIRALTTSLTTCLLSKGSTIDKLVGNGLKTVLDIAFTAVEAL
ncbi:hypothetical protein MAM1_0059c03749 [Mucor ambiguus]|uniref:Uncharacterized protein n=1 Tax=Mucor ambiguus TaxID=91626 RepID=A0A0C9MAF9_9FUNG|nr:hypothetical protein MAM1_0059c03749 [Mucor ambiguus]